MGVGWVGNKNQSFTGVGVGVGRCGGKIDEKLQPANPRSHANFRKNVPEGFKSNSDTAKL